MLVFCVNLEFDTRKHWTTINLLSSSVFLANTLRNCRRPKGSSTGTFSFTLKTQLIFVIFKHILFDCFRFQFL